MNSRNRTRMRRAPTRQPSQEAPPVERRARERQALAALLDAPRFELIPLRGALERAEALAPGARVSVTASPGKPLEATVELAAALAARGFIATPHLSARMVRDRSHLAELLSSAAEAGIRHAFVVGGDAKEPGEFPDGLALLRAMAELGHPFESIGVPAYPQGHPQIPEGALLAALRDKARYADHYTTQLCFDVTAIERFLAARASEGLPLRALIGTPGVVEPRRLMSIARRIGVADVRRFARKNLSFALRLAGLGGFYRPTRLTRQLAAIAARPGSPIAGLHIYTFNAVQETERWRRQLLEQLQQAQ